MPEGAEPEVSVTGSPRRAPNLLYLAYGSNLLPRRLRARVPSAQFVTTVRLAGWSLEFHKRGQDGSAKCDLVRTPDDTRVAHGAIYRIHPHHRSLLDEAEGLGHGYELTWLRLEGIGDAFLYRAMPGYIDPRLKPFSWYVDFVHAGARHHGFPPGYVNAIGSVTCMADPDEARNRANRAVLAASEGNA